MCPPLLWLLLLLSLSTLLTTTTPITPPPLHPSSPSAQAPPSTSVLLPRRFNPLPNPYPVPGTPILLDFDPDPDAPLNPSTVTALLRKIQHHLIARIQQHGDSTIPLGVQSFHARNVALTYDSQPQWRVMRHSDLLAVLQGLRAKMANEGFRERTAVVLFKYEDGGEVETGEVDLGRLAGRGGGVVEME